MIPGSVAPPVALFASFAVHMFNTLAGYSIGALAGFIGLGVGFGAAGKLKVPQVKFGEADEDMAVKFDFDFKNPPATAFELPPGVPKYVLDMCVQELLKSHVTVNQQPDLTLRLEGVPPTCMNLAVLFVEQGRPIPCGSACLHYTGLSDKDLKFLIDFFNYHLAPHH